MQSTVNYSNLFLAFRYAKMKKKIVTFLDYGIITETDYPVMRNILQVHNGQRNDAKNLLMK